MKPTTLITFLYWAALTYYCLDANWRFAAAIRQALQDHNDAIRQQAIQELRAYDADDEAEDEY